MTMKKTLQALFLSLTLAVGFLSSHPGMAREEAEAGKLTSMLRFIEGRSAWHIKKAGTWLGEPTFVIRLKGNIPLELWLPIDNEHKVPVLRIDEGSHYYQITRSEMNELRARLSR
jgi:hypothetical protein